MSIARLLACFAMLIAATSHAEESTVLDAFAAKLDRAAQTDDFVGLAVVIIRDDEVVLLKTYGTRDTDSDDQVTADTVFRIASLSKGFSATLAALFVEDGKLSWHKPVAEIVTEFVLKDPTQSKSATISHVLSHRLGLPPYAYDNLLEAGKLPRAILTRYKNVDLLCPVGKCYAYQNVGFNMIADVIEGAAARPFEESMRERIFEPLGLRSATIGRDALAASADWARPHVRRRNGPWRTTRVDQAYYNVPAAGGINASITDMATWLKAQMGGVPDIIPPRLLDLLHEPQVTTRAETRRMRALRGRLRSSHYGFGWRIYDYAGHEVINHSGGVRGYMAQIAFLPEHHVGIVILANTDARRSWRILPTFLDLQLGLAERNWLMLADEPRRQGGASGTAAH